MVRIVLRSKNLFEDALRVSWTILLKIKMKLVTIRQDRIQIGENTERSRLVVNLYEVNESDPRSNVHYLGSSHFTGVFRTNIMTSSQLAC